MGGTPQISRNPGGKRAEPVNMDAGAVFDKDWLKNSFDTIASDEWRKSGKETVCRRAPPACHLFTPVQLFPPHFN
jgi:hypothetical protein